MDLTTLSSVLLPALGALGLIGTYLSRQSRRDRSRLRAAERWMQEADLHMYFLERDGYTQRGRRPPPRPKILEIRHDATDDIDAAGPADEEAGGGGARGGARHALREG